MNIADLMINLTSFPNNVQKRIQRETYICLFYMGRCWNLKRTCIIEEKENEEEEIDEGKQVKKKKTYNITYVQRRYNHIVHEKLNE